jgi:hypothetical protein
MTGSQAMFQAVARAVSLLESTAVREMAGFVRAQQNADGGFRGRAGASDLYYSVFGLECLGALDPAFPLESTRFFLDAFGDGNGLDFVHMTCLARCRSHLPATPRGSELNRSVARQIEAYHCSKGGFGRTQAPERGTVYESFLAFLAYENLGREFPDPIQLPSCLESWRNPDGSYANESGMAMGTTPVTAAAAVLLAQLGRPALVTTRDWLLARCDPRGGFRATPVTPRPDLLSTATALQALNAMGGAIEAIRLPCLDFVQGLWTDNGGFCGHGADDTPDCEYTFYGLLALGNLHL